MNDIQPVRVVLLTSPATYGAIIINTLAEQSAVELVGVGLSNRVYRGKGLFATIRTSVKRTGWRYTVYNALAANVAWTWLRLRGRPIGLSVVSKRDTWQINYVNSMEWIDRISSLRPDYVVSFYSAGDRRIWAGSVHEVPQGTAGSQGESHGIPNGGIRQSRASFQHPKLEGNTIKLRDFWQRRRR
ncbi:MAG: hypothetical protein O3A00_00430 [Planctomycetota bacterium]|nr:hypothetical protein [Planctomycetota bacterium]